MKRRSAHNITVVAQKIDDAEITCLANSSDFVHRGTQRFRYSRPGVEKVHIDAARTIMARSRDLCYATIFPRPAHAPSVHGADALGPFLTQQLCKGLVA